MRIASGVLVLTALALAGCPESTDSDGGLTSPDAVVRDGGLEADAGEPAAAAADAEVADDAQAMDADAPDASEPDASEPDASEVDGGAAEADAEPSDIGEHPDATTPDAGPPPDAGFTNEVITDENGNMVVITNGPPGLPANVGCSDGQREGLVDDSVYPDMAACLGTWGGTVSLRATQTSTACGDDLGTCPEAVDLCAGGWHVCGNSGRVAEVSQLSANECENAGGGRYVTAISHCLAQSGCQYDTSTTAVYNCWASGWCSEPVCCGQSCLGFGACRDGVWPGATHIPPGTDQGCARISSRRAGGVLCCRNSP